MLFGMALVAWYHKCLKYYSLRFLNTLSSRFLNTLSSRLCQKLLYLKFRKNHEMFEEFKCE